MDDHGRCPKTRKEGKHMNDLRTTDRRNQALAWGAIFIAVGAVNLIPGAPRGAGLLAIGAILLGLNLTRFRGGIPMNGISLALGAACFLVGGFELLRPSLGFRVELPFFPTLLIALGAVCVARGLTTRAHPAPDRP
jgi:hypothetical protein